MCDLCNSHFDHYQIGFNNFYLDLYGLFHRYLHYIPRILFSRIYRFLFLISLTVEFLEFNEGIDGMSNIQQVIGEFIKILRTVEIIEKSLQSAESRFSIYKSLN